MSTPAAKTSRATTICVSAFTLSPQRGDVRRRPRQLGYVDPSPIRVVSVRRHPPLLQPAPAVALDHAHVAVARLTQEAAGVRILVIDTVCENPRRSTRYRTG